ncbi:hypothetical protein BGX20_009161 [Mortierella sp. AD010]|nr:hypothetical protein BGX20_009161 [Mortierella sp. AD010]
MNFISECTKDTSDESDDEHGQDHLLSNNNSKSRQYTRFALLHPTTPGTGVLEVLEEGQDIRHTVPIINSKCTSARAFSMAMMEKSWSRLGAFVDQANVKPKPKALFRLEEMPGYISGSLKPSQVTNTPTKSKLPMSKPLPGEIVENIEDPPINIERAESIDDPCLNLRKAYLRYLYQDETVSDYVRRLNTASKEITALAAKLGIPLKEAQQKLVAFIIEFLRIWPSKMGSKYRQIAKELNAGKITESKTQENYVILDDERPELDAWKAQVMKNVSDENVRLYLRKLKAKDTQIQIVQNLHILLLIDKYGLEENKPFKKDPGALKTINSFMDELCIAASVEDQPSGLMSPQTPRSKDMDSAKKFFTRVVNRYYEPSLPKIVEKLAIKCGVETSLLASPRPSRGSKRAGIKRSASLGVLQKPSRLDLTAAMQTEPAGPSSSNASTPIDGTASKSGFPMTRQLTSENSSRNVLNSSIFRNRQVVMTRGSVQGVGMPPPVAASNSTAPTQAKPLSSSFRSKSIGSADLLLEDEDAPPKIAKLRLKQFYHDKESEEVLKLFRRQRPLSKADMVESNPFGPIGDNDVNEDDDDDDDDDDDLGALGKYLNRKGTTSWGVIKSTNVPASHSDILKSPSRGASQRRSSPKMKRDTSPLRRYSFLSSSTSSLPPLSLPSESVVPSTPTMTQRHSYQNTSRSPSTPTRRTQFRRHQSQQSFFSSSRLELENEVIVPSTPTRRSRTQSDHSLSSQIREDTHYGFDVLGSPSKRRRGGGGGDDDDDVDIDNKIRRMPRSPSLSHYRRSHQVRRSPTSTWLMQPSSLLDKLRSTEPDRKRVHLDNEVTTGGSKLVLVPGTPSSSLSTAASGWMQSNFPSVTVSTTDITSSAMTESSLSSLDSALSSKNTTTATPTHSSFLVSTPKSAAKSAALAAAHFGLKTPEMYISSPTPVRQTTQRQIDFSLFSADD